ncbi:MAG: biotin/lipoyl-containing protein [Planctomycetota bacterium]
MRYYVQIQSQIEEVEVTRAGEQLMVAHGGEQLMVSAATIDQGARYSLLVAGRSLDVIAEMRGSQMLLIVNGHSHRIVVEDERERAARRISGARSSSGRQTVTSPMPGVVRAVRVSPGARVQRGQPLVILEAMKMENEIAAEGEGVVETVRVAPGAAVNQGDALVVIGPLLGPNSGKERT